jgi:hypothetical protein
VRGNFFLGPGVRRPGDLTLQSVTLRGGSSAYGGGVSNFFGGTLTIQNSIISGNTGSGGVFNDGTLTIKNSTISGNMGSGVSNAYGGTLTIENSTISGNTTNSGGGGVSNGGGHLTITNSTISSNIANQGGGIFNSQACDPFFGCSPATLNLNRSLIAGNQAATGPEIENSIILDNFMGPLPLNNVNANNFNLFGSNGNAGVTGFAPGPTDIVPGVPLAQILGPLKNNGGPTPTHALVPGSPAIDAGDPGGCRDSQGALLNTDQRGFARHVDGNNDGTARCDIGAVEGVGGAAIPLIDFDGDGITDIGVYRKWYVVRLAIIGRRSESDRMGRSATGYTGAGRLRWRWQSGHRGVPRWDMVYHSIIGWDADLSGLGRSSRGHSAQLTAERTRIDNALSKSESKRTSCSLLSVTMSRKRKTDLPQGR